jgi:hypothetical protein
VLLLLTISLLISRISYSRFEAMIRVYNKGSSRLVDSRGAGIVLVALASPIGAIVYRRL